MKLTLPPALLVALLRIRAQQNAKADMKRTFIFEAGLAIAMLLLNQPEMKDYLFCVVIAAFTLGLPYLIFLLIREGRRARPPMPQSPPSPAPPVQPSLPTPPPLALKPPSGTPQQDEEMPEFLDLSPEDFAIYFEAYERKLASLLGLKPGEPVPPLNSKAHRRKP